MFPTNNTSPDTDAGGSGNSDQPSDGSEMNWTTSFVLLGITCCLANCFIIYCVMQYYRYQSGGSPGKQAGRQVQQSNGLLTVEDIQARIRQLKG
jgi:hypothetical protein